MNYSVDWDGPGERDKDDDEKISDIIKDVCEIDVAAPWNSEDNPHRIVMTVAHLELILRRHLLGEE